MARVGSTAQSPAKDRSLEEVRESLEAILIVTHSVNCCCQNVFQIIGRPGSIPFCGISDFRLEQNECVIVELAAHLHLFDCPIDIANV